MTLDELLALLPDNTTGEISAADLRTIVTELWNYTGNVQEDQHELVVTSVPALQTADQQIDGRLDVLESKIIVGGLTSDGTLVAPVEWNAEMLEPGLYKVTHNLGTTEYAVVITPLAKTIDGWSPAVEATDETSFTFGVYSAAHGGLHGVYVNFVVVLR